jgi:hypothetical protein
VSFGGRPDQSGRSPTGAPIRSRAFIALNTAVEPPTAPTLRRNWRRVIDEPFIHFSGDAR